MEKINSRPDSFHEGMGKGRNLVWVLILCGAGLVVSIAVLAAVPPVSKDALVHHLAVPKLYLRHGGMVEIPFMPFSYYPMNLDLLYLIPLALGNDILPKYIHFCFGLLTAWLIFQYLIRRLSRVYAIFGAVFFLSLPIILKLSITVYVDLGIVFFSTAALLFILKWSEKDYRWRYLVLAGIFCGLGMGTKYNGLLTFFLLFCVVTFLAAQQPNRGFRRPLTCGVLFAATALLVFSPWGVRNIVWTGNPIYPLYNEWFSGESVGSASSVNRFLLRSELYDESGWEMALLPVKMFFQGEDGNPQYFDGRLNPFLLFLPILAFWRITHDSKRIRTEKIVLTGYAVTYFAFAFFTYALRARYVTPILPCLVILSAYGLSRLRDLGRVSGSPGFRKLMGWALILIGVFALGWNGSYLVQQFEEVRPLSYLTGKVSRDGYIAKHRYEYPVMRFIKENLPSDATILFIHMGNRGYYCSRDYVYDLQQNKSIFYEIIRKADGPGKIVHDLKQRGITHLLIRYDIFDKWVQGELNQRERSLLKAFFESYVTLRYFKWGYGLSTLSDNEENVDDVTDNPVSKRIL